MRDSIFYSSIRSLFVAFFTIIGIVLGLFVFLLLLGALTTSKTEHNLTTVNTHEIMPNAEGKREILASDTPVILQINLDGIIGTEALSAETIRQKLIESREGALKGDRVKAILLYINTPGGTVIDADGIFRALKEYKQKYQIPIYAYVDGLCTSGGMYVAAAADKIFSSDVSIIGSVGVIAPAFLNFSKTLDKLGVETLTLTAGKGKDAMNPLRPWKPGEENEYKSLVDYYYQSFVDLVTSNRPTIDKTKLVQDYGAQVFSAPQALERGFIDVTGVSLSDTIKALLDKVGIEGNHYQVVKLDHKDWWTSLFGGESALFKGVIKHQVQLSPDQDFALQNKFLYLYRP